MLIKVCGLTRQQDLDLCASLKVDLCGFVFHRPSPRYISPEAAGQLDSHTCRRVGVFTTHDPEQILREAQTARLDWIQLHANQTDQLIRQIDPSRTIRVWTPATTWPLHAPLTPYILMDAGYGTGRCLDWHNLPHTNTPFIIAGGLDATTVPAMLQILNPAGIDLNSGVETAPGIKDHRKLSYLLEQLKDYHE